MSRKEYFCQLLKFLQLTIYLKHMSDAVAVRVQRWTRNREVAGLTPISALLCNPRQIVHTLVSLYQVV